MADCAAQRRSDRVAWRLLCGSGRFAACEIVAKALGRSRSTFIRRVLPYVATVEMPWGAKLIPVDELERLLAEQRQAARPRTARPTRGRRPLVQADVLERIRTERRKARACISQRLASTQTGPRPRTAVRSGGARPFAPPWPALVRPNPLQRRRNRRLTRVGRNHARTCEGRAAHPSFYALIHGRRDFARQSDASVACS